MPNLYSLFTIENSENFACAKSYSVYICSSELEMQLGINCTEPMKVNELVITIIIIMISGLSI